MKKEALLYEKLGSGLLHCFLCAHHCKIPQGKFGFCGVRQNLEGVLYTYAFGEVIAAHVDPIEKKPFYHFLPGSSSFSVATVGCNFRCAFCQNWQISQRNIPDNGDSFGNRLSPEEIVGFALKNSCRSISYTYTEPTIFFEYALETARFAKRMGLKNTFVTNGYMTKECLEMIAPFLDAANVDLKFFNEAAYKKICAGSLQPVLETIKLMHALGIWIEVTTLVIPGQNDSLPELEGIAGFISAVDERIPWHVSRFHPDYEFSDYPATPEAVLDTAQTLGRQAGLKYVYAGNVYAWDDSTYCASCGKSMIKRDGFSVIENKISNGKCPYCKMSVPGVF